MVCRSIKPNVNKVCIGDLSKKIAIQYSSSVPSNSPNSNSTTSFKDIKKVWAMIKTRRTGEFIKNTNIRDTITTEFYIRYDSSIDFQQKLWVEYNDKRYVVINYENIDEQDRFIVLSAVERGKKSINANQR
jgi:SPP1 family predicted phage head-tail adaptor